MASARCEIPDMRRQTPHAYGEAGDCRGRGGCGRVRCHQSEQTNPIFGVYGLRMRVERKNEAKRSQFSRSDQVRRVAASSRSEAQVWGWRTWRGHADEETPMRGTIPNPGAPGLGMPPGRRLEMTETCETKPNLCVLGLKMRVAMKNKANLAWPGAVGPECRCGTCAACLGRASHSTLLRASRVRGNLPTSRATDGILNRSCLERPAAARANRRQRPPRWSLR